MAISFAEESCWIENERREVRLPVIFQLSWAKPTELLVGFEFEADFGLWYDPNDLRTIETLRDCDGGIPWERYIYWKKQDHSCIEVIDPWDDEVVAVVRVRRAIPDLEEMAEAYSSGRLVSIFSRKSAVDQE